MNTNRMGLEQSTLSDGELIVITDTDHVQCGDAAAMARELLAYRKASSEPVAWTDEVELRSVEKDGCGYLFKANPITPHADPRRVIMLYAAAPPQAATVPDEMTIRDACKFVQDMRIFDDVSVIVMRTWNACRAAMLKSVTNEP
jgi:hypothetical protein